MPKGNKFSPQQSRKAVRILEEEGRPVRFRHDWRYLHGTMSEMPIEPIIAELISEANRTVLFAQSVRKAHSRKSKKGTRQRETDIKSALQGLQRAMKPIRRRIARLPYLAPGMSAEGLHVASEAIQRERRKLWKMRQPSKRESKLTKTKGV